MGNTRERPEGHNEERVRGIAPLVILFRRRRRRERDGGEGRILREQEAGDSDERGQGVHLQASLLLHSLFL